MKPSADINLAVRAFYDRHPYPPPINDLDGYGRHWGDPEKQRADYHLFWPHKPYREDLDILVAGCGTAQAARYALRHLSARVTGIDISDTSIAHTEKLKHRYGLTNLEVRQLSVERANELDRRFDKIICTGVLHHLSDPDAGLRALAGVLKPDGAMHLMVYAAYGRTGIYMLQEYCRILDIGRSDQEITDIANTLMSLPQDHPLAHLLREVPDFRTKAGLADALLHPQDRAYTVPQFFDFIEGAGLTFGRWHRQAPYHPQCGDPAKTPHVLDLLRLEPEAQHAAVELFRGTMVRHNAIVQRSGSPFGCQTIRFDGDAWERYIPIRLPRTRCIEDRLPPGAQAVLLNQSHTYPDLILPVNIQEKQLFEAIDGHRTIADISDVVRDKVDPERRCTIARTFFQKLWQYDQVVFDATRQSG